MNVTIRPLEEKDAHTSVKWRNMPEVWRYKAHEWTHEITLDDELAWIRKAMSDSTSSRFAILADDVYVGNAYITNIKDGIGEYSIFIGEKEYWGKGVARKASAQIIDYGKSVLKLKMIMLGVHPSNIAAINIYKDFGFSDTGKKLYDVFMLMKLNLADWNSDLHDTMR